MSAVQTSLFGDEDCEYDLDYIVNNPILAKCTDGKSPYCKGEANINAPQLDNVRCFWCGGKLKPIDHKVYRERIANLWQHVSKA